MLNLISNCGKLKSEMLRSSSLFALPSFWRGSVFAGNMLYIEFIIFSSFLVIHNSFIRFVYLMVGYGKSFYIR